LKVIKPYRPFSSMSTARAFGRKYHVPSHILKTKWPVTGNVDIDLVLDFNPENASHIALEKYQQDERQLKERWVFNVSEDAIVEDILIH